MSPIGRNSQYFYPSDESSIRMKWDNKPQGDSLKIDYSQRSTPAQQFRDKAIKGVAIAVIAALAATLISSVVVATAFYLAAATGITVIVKQKPDLDDPVVRTKITQQFFKKPPTLAEFANKFSISDVYDYQLLPSHVNYTDYALLATRFKKNQTQFANDMSEIAVKAKASIDPIKSDINKAKSDLKKVPQNVDKILNFIKKDFNSPGCAEVHHLVSGHKHMIVEEKRVVLEAKMEQAQHDINEVEKKEAHDANTAQIAYKNSLLAVEAQFKALISPDMSTLVIPVAMPVNVRAYVSPPVEVYVNPPAYVPSYQAHQARTAVVA